MTDEQQPQAKDEKAEKQDEKQPQMEGDNVVDTNAGEDAKEGTIAEESDEPTKAK